MPTRVPVLYGAAFFGAAGTGVRKPIEDPAQAQKFVDVLVKQGQLGLDTSRAYGAGTSEQLLSQLELHGARVDTKVYPSTPGDHAPGKLKELLHASRNALGPHNIRVFYLHAPDRTVSFEDTLRAVDELYKQGQFEEFGLSNFNSWEVAEIVGICKTNGWIRPTVYQGIYNCLERTIETELVPCARKFGLRLAAYSPLAGGFLVGKYLNGAKAQQGSHFDPNWTFGPWFIDRYMPMIPALQTLKDIVDKHQLTLSEIAARWLQHHSVFTPDDHGVIFGGSTPDQLEIALKDSAKGPLPEEVVAALDTAYSKVKGGVPHYAI